MLCVSSFAPMQLLLLLILFVREDKSVPWTVCYHSVCVLSHQFDLDSIWTFIFGMPASSTTVVGSIHSVYPEAAFLLLAMLRSMLNLVRSTEPRPSHGTCVRLEQISDERSASCSSPGESLVK